eukprot:624833_1
MIIRIHYSPSYGERCKKHVLMSYKMETKRIGWFKQFIVPSTIWYQKINVSADEDTDGKTDDTTVDDTDGEPQMQSTYLYYKLLELVDNESKSELDNLKNDLNVMADHNHVGWKELTTRDIPKEITNEYEIVRQDKVPNAIESRYSHLELLQHSGVSAQFVSTKFYDYNEYLPQLVLLAHTVDDDFQKSIQKIFVIDKKTNIGRISDEKEEKRSCDGVMVYRRGPVKLLSRCQSKCENDYS